MIQQKSSAQAQKFDPDQSQFSILVGHLAGQSGMFFQDYFSSES
jgi:hypothetical protein